MIRKKGGFLTFIFSFWPGAGEMYMGFMKQGVSLMGVFLFIISIASWTAAGPLLFVVPIIWFYSFFHVHNLRSLPDEEFYALEDDYLFHVEGIFPKGEKMDKRIRVIAAIILIFIGVNVLWNNLTNFLYWILPYWMRDYFHSVVRSIPQLITAVALILFGIWLIRGKKEQLDKLEHEKDGDKYEN